MQNNRDYKKLFVWQKAVDLTTDVYRLTSKLPTSENFGLISQMRRSAVSIPSNIAEGSKRKSLREYEHFLNISLGSGAELETQILISQNLYPSSAKELNDLSLMLNEVLKMLSGLIKALNEQMCASNTKSHL